MACDGGDDDGNAETLATSGAATTDDSGSDPQTTASQTTAPQTTTNDDGSESGASDGAADGTTSGSSGDPDPSAGNEDNPCGDVTLAPFEPFEVAFGGDAPVFSYEGGPSNCIINGIGGFFGQWTGSNGSFELVVAPGPEGVGVAQSSDDTTTFEVTYNMNFEFEFRSLAGKLTYVAQTEPHYPDTICLHGFESMEGLGDSAGQTATVPGPIALACPVPGTLPPR